MLQAPLDFSPLRVGEGLGFGVDGFPDAFDEVEAFLHAEFAYGFQVDGHGWIIARGSTVGARHASP